MKPHRWNFGLVFLLIWGFPCAGQDTLTKTCAIFSSDGSLALGTIRNGELETRLAEAGSPVVTTRTLVGNSFGCEEAFSDDGRWLATVVANDKLTVLISDRKTGTIYRQFSSDWHTFHNMALEPGYRSPFLGGFSKDGSLVLWRYVPQRGATDSDASNVNLHLQRWGVDGVLLEDKKLGVSGFGINGRGPLIADGLEQLWIPGGCGTLCYRTVSLDESHVRRDDDSLTLPKNTESLPIAVPHDTHFLSVLGEGRTDQKAALFDHSGKIDSEVSLPYFPNLLGPLVPDWFYARRLAISPDGQVAIIGRTRVAWVLVDTDRDWGSEVVVLKLNPLSVLTTLKTGKGGLGALAVDHRNGAIRLVGFWKDRWHDMSFVDASPGKWNEAVIK